MKTKIFIVGARGFGREVFDLIIQTSTYQNHEWEIAGYLDSKSDALDGYSGYPPIIESVEDHSIETQNRYVCAMGTPDTKKHYVKLLKNKGAQFINVIHPKAILRSTVNHAEGLLIFSHAILSVDIQIGSFVTIQSFNFIGHDAKIGDWCHFNSHVSVNGFCVIEESAQLYTHATILPKFTIGAEAVIGAGAVVMKNVNEKSTVFGNPAREMKMPS